MNAIDWWALPICPRCFRQWVCWTVHRGHPSRPMSRPHVERARAARA